MVAYYLGYTPPFNSLGSLQMGMLPLYQGSHEKSISGTVDRELSLSEIGQLYVQYQQEAIKQKLALAAAHDFRPDLNFEIEQIGTF